MSSEHHESAAKGPDGRMVDRMLFFSDAVFAIVLTIMVLELHAPLLEAKGALQAQSADALWAALAGMKRTFFAYVLSFILIGLWWMIHMRVTRSLHRFDWLAAVSNLLFILTMTLIPFVTSVLGENATNAAAWTLYWGLNAAVSFALTVMMVLIMRDGGRLIGGVSPRERLSRLIQSGGPGVAFVIGAVLAGEGRPDLSQWCWVIIPPLMSVARAVSGKAAKPAADQPL